MKRILTIIGARPQIIKSAAISRAIRTAFPDQLKEDILHTGQHYDEKMSAVFFDELQIPQPDFNLNVGSGSHGAQTAKMLEGIEEVLLNGNYDGLLVYGDTNSTLAGAIAAVKLHIPVIHVEAGLRSFNKAMPEEVNRITCDHASSLLFSPTTTGVDNLLNEGFKIDNSAPYHTDNPGVFHCGDVMYDNSRFFGELADEKVDAKWHSLKDEAFILATIHRPYNTDDTDRLLAIFDDLRWLCDDTQMKLVLPLHPRTKNILQAKRPEQFQAFADHPKVELIEPVSFLEMTFLEKHSRLIVTGSGGVQKEAYFFQKPSVVIRTETEWVELIAHGSARLSFETGEAMRQAFRAALETELNDFPPYFGDGKASEFICQTILDSLK
ncbi:MAG: UDP-N-acetylglucosamine 2-epimerase (non-hydrolyzing) [Flavobacteriales bacterium]|nr:UDP-N-acetylglucosamine 2-epimerase (non-hydrolyzing) [Flavobacteriales bacterium]